MPEEMRADQLDRTIDAILHDADSAAISGDFAEIVAQLRLLPDEQFKERLKSDLQRRPVMSTTAVAPETAIREGFRTVTPYIAVVEGDRLIEFLKKTFHAEETLRHSQAPGSFHAEVRLGDSMLMIGSGERLRGHERRTALHIYVDDCDATWKRAIEAGATSMGEPADRPYGERSGFCKDASGNIYFIATRFPSNPAPEGMASLLPFFFPKKAIPYIEFLERAFGGERMFVYEHEGHVVHAAVRIGDAVIEMGESQDEARELSSSWFLYVKDVDAFYNRAVAAGATSVHPPINQPYGHREAELKDPVGYTWYPASLTDIRQEN